MTKPVVVVLGGAGFIGRHVCRQFASSGFSVYALGHGSWTDVERATWGVERWSAVDITLSTLREAVGDCSPEILVHCGGSGSVSAAFHAPFDDYNRSVLTVASMLEYVRIQAGSKTRVVLASSAAVYGDQGEIDLVETAHYAPISPYGFSKLAAENLCRTYNRFFGVSCSIVRLFSVYGEGLRKQLLWDALKKLSADQAMFFGNGQEMRDWIHVEDAARLIFLAATSPAQAPFEVYNGANEKSVIRDVLCRLFQKAGSQLSPSFSGQMHSGNPSRLTANVAYAQSRLNWQPIVSLDEGLSRYVNWFPSAGRLE